MTARWTIIPLVALALAACGRKAPPKPPEFVAPRAITDLQATNGTDGVVLVWSRPRRHADGTTLANLGGFVIERAALDRASSFQPLTTVQLADRERFRQTRSFRYLDREPAIGSTYTYRIIAFTDDGYYSEPSNSASLTRELPPPTPAGAAAAPARQ